MTDYDLVAEALYCPRLGETPIRIDEFDCWVWTAARSGGYGVVGQTGRRRSRYVHRIAYEAAVGPIPDGLDIDHLCRNTACVNPAHLEPVTRGENIRRSPRGKFACVHGHSYLDPANSRDRKGSPNCLVCKRERDRRAYIENREAIRERDRKRYIKNREVIREQQRAYYAKNREAQRERARANYHAKKQAAAA